MCVVCQHISARGSAMIAWARERGGDGIGPNQPTSQYRGVVSSTILFNRFRSDETRDKGWLGSSTSEGETRGAVQ